MSKTNEHWNRAILLVESKIKLKWNQGAYIMVRVPKYERMTWRNLSFWSFCVRWWYLALATTFVLVNVETLSCRVQVSISTLILYWVQSTKKMNGNDVVPLSCQISAAMTWDDTLPDLSISWSNLDPKVRFGEGCSWTWTLMWTHPMDHFSL